LFRQAMFGEYEARIYSLSEHREMLTGERLTREYLDLLEAYHGTAEGVMTIEPAYALEWAYIPHFYLTFYVFQYATSIAASSMFTERLMEAAPERAHWWRICCAAYPYDMFVEAGVDLASPAPYRTPLTRTEAVMDQMKAILAPTTGR
jgi:oligoendopeptidase F